MVRNKNLKVCFAGGNQAAVIGALTVLSKGNTILSAVSYSEEFTLILNSIGIPVYKTVNDKGFISELADSDILLSVHGREIVKSGLLKLPKFGGVNIHPYLYKYKGADPVGRALRDKEFKASVGAHIMQQRLDEGKVLVEEFVDVSGSNSVDEIYNKLYFYYCIVVLKVLDIIYDESKKYQT